MSARGIAAAMAAASSAAAAGYWMGSTTNEQTETKNVIKTESKIIPSDPPRVPLPPLEKLRALNSRAADRMKEALEHRTNWDTNWDK